MDLSEQTIVFLFKFGISLLVLATLFCVSLYCLLADDEKEVEEEVEEEIEYLENEIKRLKKEW